MHSASDHVAAADGDAAGGPLENTANNVSPPLPNRVGKRRDRFALRALLWRLTNLQRLSHCGRVPRSLSTHVTVRARDGVAGFANLQHCGSVWSCPVCSASILTHRALEIGSVLGQAVAEGHSLGFGTLTMRHRSGQPLKALWGAAAKGWRRAITGNAWVRAVDAHGVLGWVRVWEVTDGRNGWHVHVHFVVVLPSTATAESLDSLGLGMFGRWAAGLRAAGLSAPRLVGQDWHLAAGENAAGDLAEYLFKLTEQAAVARAHAASLGLELTHTLPGRSRSDLATRPVWSLLDDVGQGDADALARWHEWELGSKGRKQVGWSNGLRERFAPTLPDVTDEDIADQETGSSADDLVAIPHDGWAQLVRTPAELPRLLEAAEWGGVAALRVVLDELGVPYEVVVRDALVP